MGARKYDRELGIRTVGLREWGQDSPYNRYEATPYEALDALFRSYRFRLDQRVVDFGCGRGRVVFAIHRRFQVSIVGIEAHDKTYEEALENKAAYRLRAGHIQAPIRLKYGLAEHYRIKPKDNCFYFFNPFSGDIFRKVLGNIVASLEKYPRSADVILYYPLPVYKRTLRHHSFHQINKIRVPGMEDPREKFVVYRWTPVDEDN